jgi:hypothetical protein
MISKRRFWPLVAALLCLCVAPAQAQEKTQDEAARSEFIYRVNLGRADDVRLLIRQGASPNQVSGEGVPVICLAAGRIDAEAVNIIEALIDAGANVNARDSKGQNPLFYAAKAGNIASINYLMQYGVDPYALDNNGDVARTAGFKAGQKDAVKAIDDYILKQTAEITQQYRERNREMARRAKAPRGAKGAAPTDAPENPATTGAKGALAAIKAPAPSPDEAAAAEDTADAGTDAEATPPAPAASGGAPTPAPAATAPEEAAPEDFTSETPEEKASRIEDETNQTIYSLAFNVCAYQYWSYCSSAKQSVDIDHEELIIAIESSRTEAERLKRVLSKDYQLAPKIIDSITGSAQKRIYRELNGMASNRDRHEQGVGKRDDMQSRCEEIGRQWGAKPPTKIKSNNDDDNQGRGRGKGGSGKAGGKKGASRSKKGGAGKGGASKAGSKGGKGSAPAPAPAATPRFPGEI